MSDLLTASPNWWRFWSRVEAGPAGLCWEWTGPISHKGGYAIVRANKRNYLAHRLAWMFAHGTIPEGLVIRHKCDNPKCCNPLHLELGTHLDNQHDMIIRGRRKKSGAKGTRNCKAKLSDSLVREIRALYASGSTSTPKLAQQYGVTQGLISQIVLKRIWRHVDD
jgi:hypothetical protein